MESVVIQQLQEKTNEYNLFYDSQFISQIEQFSNSIKLNINSIPESIQYIQNLGYFINNSATKIEQLKSTDTGFFQSFFTKKELIDETLFIINKVIKTFPLTNVVILSVLDFKHFYDDSDELTITNTEKLLHDVRLLEKYLRKIGITDVSKGFVEVITNPRKYTFFNLEDPSKSPTMLSDFSEPNTDLVIFFPPINGIQDLFEDKSNILSKIKTKFVIDEFSLSESFFHTNNFITFTNNFIGKILYIEKKNHDFELFEIDNDGITVHQEKVNRVEKTLHLYGLVRTC